MRDNRLKLFGRIQEDNGAEIARFIMKFYVEGKRGKLRTKKRWIDRIKNDMRMPGVI